MGLSHEHAESKILEKIQIYILTRAELLFTLCLEIPCNWFFPQILPYVNGTLYSLLTNPKIAASARSLHISEKLKLAITATANDTDLGGKDIDIKYSKQLEG